MEEEKTPNPDEASTSQSPAQKRKSDHVVPTEEEEEEEDKRLKKQGKTEQDSNKNEEKKQGKSDVKYDCMKDDFLTEVYKRIAESNSSSSDVKGKGKMVIDEGFDFSYNYVLPRCEKKYRFYEIDEVKMDDEGKLRRMIKGKLVPIKIENEEGKMMAEFVKMNEDHLTEVYEKIMANCSSSSSSGVVKHKDEDDHHHDEKKDKDDDDHDHDEKKDKDDDDHDEKKDGDDHDENKDGDGNGEKKVE